MPIATAAELELAFCIASATDDGSCTVEEVFVEEATSEEAVDVGVA